MYTILAVDDHFSNLRVLIESLERLDYMVIAVNTGEEALRVLEGKQTVDLVILDLMMPGMSGFDVCRTIRQRHSLVELPVLMVTASILSEDKLAAFDAGANDFLPKPFDRSELTARVKGLLLMKELAGKAVDLEVAFLQSQIKPHFLFNVLSTIMSLSYTDASESRNVTANLADYLRGSFSFGNVQKDVPFRTELDLIRSYVEIEKARFQDRIRVEYDIADSAGNVRLLPLLIQPLVENAIRHGIGNRVEGGTIKVRAYEEGTEYVFTVEDDGDGLTGEQLEQVMANDAALRTSGHQGVGLRNIGKRLKYAYGTSLRAESSPGQGTKMTVRVPYALK